MNGDRLIFPDILTDSFDELQEKISQVVGFSNVVHVDVIDGLYADNLTVSARDLQDVDFGTLDVDVHILTLDPEDYLGDVFSAGAKRAIGQVEKMHSLEAYVERCLEYSLVPGLGLDLYTSTDLLEPFFDKLEVVLLMSVKAGFSGQTYHSVAEKILDLRDGGFLGDIVVDGGLNEESILECLEAGANQFAVNSSLWQTDSATRAYQSLQKLVTGYGLLPI